MGSGGVDVIVGGQYGSEAKGKICSYLAFEYEAAVRGGAENAGHTIIHNGTTYKMQIIPVAWVNPKCRLYVGGGAVFSLPQLWKELAWTSARNRLWVDPNAMILQERHVNLERALSMDKSIGSTIHGCGAALAEKIMRNGARLAKDTPELEGFIANHLSLSSRVSLFINAHIEKGERVMLEGTQGTLLSLDHSPHYPFATSRNVTGAAIAAENGVATSLIRETILVLRALPIRVGGHSGPTGGKELTWETVSEMAGRPVEEFTTVTNRRRRIFEFDWAEALYSVMLNRPTQIALTFADYLEPENYHVSEFSDLGKRTKDFISRIERETQVPVTLISTGSEIRDMIDRRARAS